MMGWTVQAAPSNKMPIKAFLSVKKAKLTCRFQIAAFYF
jgi:hypothetical protein